MDIFSKEKLLKIVAVARRRWWLFIPVLLIITLGYITFAILDNLHILLLRIRNAFLLIYNAIYRCTKVLYSFLSRIFGKASTSVCEKRYKLSSKLHQMGENAQTARAELLQSAVDLFTERHERRENKKAELREAARLYHAKIK